MLDVRGKRIHVIGLGAKGTGRACAQVLGGMGARITISDTKSPQELAGEIAQLGDAAVRLQLGVGEAYRDIETADMVVPSPGVPLASDAIQRALQAGVPMYSEIELAYRLAQAPLLAITGTKGKTTTTTLIGLLLAALGKTTYVGGNIGVPLIELAAKAMADELLVAEVSSFQLEAVEEFHPHVAVFTNLYPDHLDRYHDSMDEYMAAKLNIFARQTAEDFAIVNVDRPEHKRVIAATQARIIPVSMEHTVSGGVYLRGGEIISEIGGAAHLLLQTSAIRLRGAHNVANIMQALAGVEVLGLPVADIATATLANFRGVPNRLEEVDTVNGVACYNDSQGTTPMAVRMALQAFAATPPVLIAGGRAKIKDFSELGTDIVAGAKAVILIGEAAADIAVAIRRVTPSFPIYFADSLEDAVPLGYRLAAPAGVLLLSPGCASFDMFRNMEHRGDVFRTAVAKLSGG